MISISRFFLKFILCFVISSIISLLFLSFFSAIFESESIIIWFVLHPFDICQCYPLLWSFLKKYFVLLCFLCNFIYLYPFLCLIFGLLKKPQKATFESQKEKLSLVVGNTLKHELIYLPAKSLYQNILITGSIGCGKTSSAMYPFTEQLIAYQNENKKEKLGMLILDVKGNFYKQVLHYAKQYNRMQDIVLLGIHSKEKYNPLHKPELSPSVLANRLKTILTLLSPNNSESFWLDKVEQMLIESIKLCRLYNQGYVTFEELYKLITFPEYYQEKISHIKSLFQNNAYCEKELYSLLTAMDFFEHEFFSLDSRTSSILKSELTRITSPFVSDYCVSNTFCSNKNQLTFTSFLDLLEKGKIVVLQMSFAEHSILCKIIATYLKLDFQNALLLRMTKKEINQTRPVCFLCDEFHEFVTESDINFLAESREAKCINIVSTQSFSSLLNTLNKETTTKVLIQNFVNKLCYRTDDLYTIEFLQKQIGKEEKEKRSITVSENAKETNFNYLLNSFLSKDSNLSESISSYSHFDYIYDSHFFTQELETFSCLAFLSNGTNILPTQKLNMIPYFIKKGKEFV